MPKTAAGEGYTVRVGSKKVLKATLLEQELEAAKKQHAELLQQNELLRAKEAMHMQLLESCEVGLRVQGEAAAARLTPSSSTAHSASLLEAALLDMQALELKQVLMPASDHPPPAPTAPAQQGPAGAAGAIRQQDSPLSTPGQKSTAASSSSHSSGGGSIFSGLGTPSEDGCESSTNRTKQLLGSLTAADVLQFQGLTLEEVGDRFRACISRLALARQASRAKQAAALDLGSTVEDFGRLCVLSLVSDELRHCRIVGLNLESMQHEAPPEGLWAEVVEKAHLQPQQREHISRAFRSCSQQQSQLLQRQREVLQQLQTVFAAKGPLSGSLATSAAADGAAAGAGASAEASAAGPAQSRPVVAAAYTDAGATHSPAGGSSRAAQATPGASPVAAAATAPAEAPLSSADLQRLANTYMQQEQDGASSSGSHGWLATAGVLNLDDAERAEQLLQELSKVSRALKQHARRLSTMIINLLTAEQHADAILTAYPFILNVPALCACIAAADP